MVGQLFEIGPGGVVQSHGRLPRAHFVDGRRKMNQRIIQPRNRSVARRSRGDQPDARAELFRVPMFTTVHAPFFDRRASAFRDRELRVDLIAVLVHHEIDTHAGGVRLFAGFRQKDHVAVQAAAVRFSSSITIRLAVSLACRPGAASPDVAVLYDRAERVDRPLFALHSDHVGVRQHQQRPLRSVALDARDQVGARRILRESLGGNSVTFQHLA